MRKIITQIRDIEIIEKELAACPAGIVALMLNNDKLYQFTTPYLYLDKNIYIFFEDESELFQNLHFDSNVSFTIIKNEKVKKIKNFTPTYGILSINILGKIKIVDDQKIMEDVRQHYLSKYKKNLEGEFDLTFLKKIIVIDTEEIHAAEEIGG